VTLIAAVLLSIRLLTAPRVVSGDTFWYARATLLFSGAGETAATDGAAAFMHEQRGDAPESWVRLVAEIDPRYPAIFASRPLYPLLAAPLLPLVGLSGLLIVSLAAGVACAAFAATAAYRIWESAIAAIAAGILVVALPSGASIAFAYADGLMIAAWTATLVLAADYLGRGGRWRVVAFAVALAASVMAKSANGMLLALTFVGLAVVLAIFRNQQRRGAIVLAGVAMAITVTYLGISPLLGFAGIGDSLQDLATLHFSAPDVADPIGLLLRRDRALIAAAPSMVAAAMIPVIACVIGLGALIQRRSVAAMVWAAAGAGSFVLVLLHPITTEIPRLVAPLWVSVALGFGGLLSVALKRLGAMRASTAEIPA
jgi:hypothetical protein